MDKPRKPLILWEVSAFYWRGTEARSRGMLSCQACLGAAVTEAVRGVEEDGGEVLCLDVAIHAAALNVVTCPRCRREGKVLSAEEMRSERCSSTTAPPAPESVEP